MTKLDDPDGDGWGDCVRGDPPGVDSDGTLGFNRFAARLALNEAYPRGDAARTDEFLDIAQQACLDEDYAATDDGAAAVRALVAMVGGPDVIEVPLDAGCSNHFNASAFLAAVGL